MTRVQTAVLALDRTDTEWPLYQLHYDALINSALKLPYQSVNVKKKNFNFRKSLQFYRGRDYDITEEFEEISSQNQKKALLAQHLSGWKLTLKRFTSSSFGRPFMCIGVLYLIMQWGEYNNLTIHMISIFTESKSSIEPELAPVFAGSIQVKNILLITSTAA